MAGDGGAEELARALAHDEIVPYLQPLVELRTERTAGFEVLARWLHPTRDVVQPLEFIPIAERSGLIGALNERLLHRACAAAADWPADIRLAVNVSPSQLRDPTLPERLQAIAEGARFPLRRLSVEITEKTVIEDFDVARRIFGILKSLGVQIALDDFGIGYSGLRRLQLLPFDALKIDAAFVESIATQQESRTIVAAIVNLCHSLGLTAVAEGIETRDQADMLRQLDCDHGQGWLFGRPMPLAEVPSSLR